MAPTSETTRRLMGCGYLPRHENARPLSPPDIDFDVTVCPGYSTSLPEVVEAVRYRPSYVKGLLTEHLGEAPSPQFIDGQNVLEGAINLFQQAEIQRRSEEAKRG